MANYSDVLKWHETLADLYLSDPDEEKAVKHTQDQARHTKTHQDQMRLWTSNRKLHHDALAKAEMAEAAAMQAGRLAEIARSPSNPKAYVSHSLVAAQIRAMMTKRSIDDSVAEAMHRLLSHPNTDVRAHALLHPNRAIFLSKMVAA